MSNESCPFCNLIEEVRGVMRLNLRLGVKVKEGLGLDLVSNRLAVLGDNPKLRQTNYKRPFIKKEKPLSLHNHQPGSYGNRNARFFTLWTVGRMKWSIKLKNSVRLLKSNQDGTSKQIDIEKLKLALFEVDTKVVFLSCSVKSRVEYSGSGVGTKSLDRSMDSDKYLEGQSMQRPPLFESDSFIYWKNRFETYVKSKDLDLWHVITNGDFQPIIQNPETKLDEVVPFEKQTDDLKRRLAKNNEAKMVIYNALPRKEYERIFMCNTAKEIWKTLLITHQGNSQVKDNKIDLLVQQYE
ncbi:hypothetical protein Tco_0127195 [Tanacetum coccineum]